MMAQYQAIKQKYPNTILLFRVGDFYETFYEDAQLVSKELNIVLTSRENAPLAGVPYHALDAYLSRLVRKGYKVAICEQLEDPKLAKGVVKRDVVRVITPGTILEDSILSEKANNYLMAMVGSNNGLGVAFVDISTGEFLTTQLELDSSYEKLSSEISRFKPSEVIAPRTIIENSKLKELFVARSIYITEYSEKEFEYEKALRKLKELFKGEILEIENLELAIRASGAVLSYLEETQKSIPHIAKIKHYLSTQYMGLDATTARNLELLQNVRDGSENNTLVAVLDSTLTGMGARTLRRWLLCPLIDKSEIIKRLNAVEILVKDLFLRKDLEERLSKIKDLERLITRISYGNATPRDLINLKNSVKFSKELKKLVLSIPDNLLAVSILKELAERIDSLEDIAELIEIAIVEEPPTHIKEVIGIIRKGYDKELDSLRNELQGGKNWITTLEARERARTGIKSLKVGYTSIFGYYIEVSRANLKLVPQDYIRKQTLANAERFTTEELKAKEALIITAEERVKNLEAELFQKVRKSIAEQANRVLETAKAVGVIDTIYSLAVTAVANNYTKPEITEDDIIKIVDGRHPVVERTTQSFVPNDTLLDCRGNKMMIITGPNMSGKSTYMRQVALITLLAQIGSFVPAKYASIGIVDRIFTRVGAFDDLVRGQSTFMVEMTEVANILKNATSKSLILLDEIGRGTSTFDGLSIAWAVAEYIHSKKISAKTMFATHYHHLTELAEVLHGVVNYNIAVKEQKDEIIFLRKLIPGGTNKSYGVKVAALAGLPKELVKRAEEILKKLEYESMIDVVSEDKKIRTISPRYTQLILPSLSSEDSEVIKELKELDINKLTPLEALIKIGELKKKCRK
ncbi:MAG: DNA mismatch repair protein MutS [Candidatus Thermoplasmatota archaeon]|nr:DNA mismatch repair protein MutS [Candidatus Thermoplasmatota archaeon]